jgi:hypothetical protein
MKLEGSCYCGKVKFRCISHTPYPYMRCYCSICRKADGGGGYAINIMAQYNSLKIDGEEHINSFHPRIDDPDQPGKTRESSGKRYFCTQCGTALWGYDERWSEWFYPYASCIDTPLPAPPETTHIMLEFKAPWVEPEINKNDKQFARYPDQSIEAWHRKHGLYQED